MRQKVWEILHCALGSVVPEACITRSYETHILWSHQGIRFIKLEKGYRGGGGRSNTHDKTSKRGIKVFETP